MKDEALRLALEALEYPLNQSHENFNVDMAELLSHRAIAAIKQALEQPEPVQQEKDWGAVAEKRLSALKQATKATTEDAVVRAVHKIMQKEPEPVPESTLMALARRCLWIAYVWNDHNHEAAYKYAREEAQAHGIKSFDDANTWLTSQPKREPQEFVCSTGLCHYRKPLTDEQIKDALVSVDAETKRLPSGFRDFARAIEAAHGIKGEA